MFWKFESLVYLAGLAFLSGGIGNIYGTAWGCITGGSLAIFYAMFWLSLIHI